MEVKYKFISFFYDLIDVFYFNRKKYSPRTAILDFLPEEKVNILDICAGTGANSLVIAKNKIKAEITAIDLSEDMLQIANKKFAKENIINIDTMVMDASKTDFYDNTYDFVLISLVLHEVDKNLRNAILGEAKRVLKDDGRIMIIEWAQPKKLFQKLMFSLIKAMEPEGFKSFLYSDLSDYFNSLGLRIVNEINCDYTKVLELLKS